MNNFENPNFEIETEATGEISRENPVGTPQVVFKNTAKVFVPKDNNPLGSFIAPNTVWEFVGITSDGAVLQTMTDKPILMAFSRDTLSIGFVQQQLKV